MATARKRIDLVLEDVVVDFEKVKYVSREEIAVACLCAVSDKFRKLVDAKHSCKEYYEFVIDRLSHSRRLRENIYLNAYIRVIKSQKPKNKKQTEMMNELIDFIRSFKPHAKRGKKVA